MRQPGDRVGRYVILGLLGRGGMGEVYEAEDTVLGRKVALKLLSSEDTSDDARERMLREARAAAAFEHTNAVMVLDVGVVEEGSGTYLAMELVRGNNLRTFVGDETIAIDRKVRWLVEAARALAAAHTRGLVHRDVKPDNLMIRADGVLKVLDFGIAKRSAAAVDPSAPTEAGQSISTLTGAGQIVGTPRYASPEQLRGEPLDGRSDQFSWGVTAYELLSGRPPFEAADAVTLISQVLSKQPEALDAVADDLPRAVSKVIMRALAKDPPDRYESLDDAASALEPYAEARTGPSDNASQKGAALSLLPPRTRRVVSRTAKIAMYASALFGAAVITLLIVAAAAGKLRFDLGKEQAAAASASAAASTDADLSALSCKAATIEGTPPKGGDLALALGVGACARVGIETGATWSPSDKAAPNAAPVDVRVTFGDATRVVVRAGGLEAEAEDKRPLQAARKAARALAAKLAPLGCEEARQRAWGASNAVQARRIETTWRRLIMDDLDDNLTEIQDLVRDAPESAWAHAMVAFVELPGSAKRKAAIEKALELTERLPPGRAKGLRGLVLAYRHDDDRPEALRLLRQAYAEDPSDADIAGVYAAMAIAQNALEEGFAVVDRVSTESPSLAIVSLRNAISAPRVSDKERNARYLARLLAILPEDAGSGPPFADAVERGDLERAKRVLEFRDALHGPESADELSSVRLALLSGRTADAIELAKKRLAQPVGPVRVQAALLLGAAHFLDGRFEDAHVSTLTEMERLRDEGNTLVTRNQVFLELRARRRTGERVPPELITAAGDPLAAPEVPLPARLQLAAELAVIDDSAVRKRQKTALEDLTRAAEAARSEDKPSALLSILPLVRAVRGDAAAVTLWRSAGQGSRQALDSARSAVAFDAALALEATKADQSEILQAYRLAMDPFRIETRPVDYLFAALRIADKKGAGPGEDQLVAGVTGRPLPSGVRERALALK
ncbi:MAG: protein kinase [Polyangiaceae bacterium]|nr:protein kinase [Polyangiaceae bacterium]